MAEIFEARDRGEAALLVSFMTLFEIIHLTTARSGSDSAFALLFKVRSLGMDEIWPEDDLLWKAGEIKSQCGLSVADAFIAATALLSGAILVHRDPEFDCLGPEVRTLSLVPACR